MAKKITPPFIPSVVSRPDFAVAHGVHLSGQWSYFLYCCDPLASDLDEDKWLQEISHFQ